ncbi:tubulin polyglutamylase complex subunit 2-like [Corticium candelabrum]|uniref:tubulin polyglutamylase complex subunit 2-like n=1 Tax=Corticium candelabrum TaxID=121492 RepID=UPI002E2619BA|nr:tubulin polyglutamylase complex subunit 2-like [Corticium candelabrum]
MERQTCLDRLTLGLIETLQKKRDVCDVKLEATSPADSAHIADWERQNGCSIPSDLKDFYLTNDGLQLTWSFQSRHSTISLGRVAVNSLSKLNSLNCTVQKVSSLQPSLIDIDTSDDEEEDCSRPMPHFDSRSKLFELDSCDPYGTVVLVYNVQTKKGAADQSGNIRQVLPYIWFLDRSLQWHWLADTFTSYYRLMLVHLGLPEWQCVFTTTGLSSEAQRWFNLFVPHRLQLDMNKGIPCLEEHAASEELFVNQLNWSRVQKARPQTTDKRRESSLGKKSMSSSAVSKQQSQSAAAVAAGGAATRSASAMGFATQSSHHQPSSCATRSQKL